MIAGPDQAEMQTGPLFDSKDPLCKLKTKQNNNKIKETIKTKDRSHYIVDAL